MLEDVLDAAESAQTIKDIIVVTSDTELEELAKHRGHEVFPPTVAGLNGELTEAIQYAETKGAWPDGDYVFVPEQLMRHCKAVDPGAGRAFQIQESKAFCGPRDVGMEA